MHTQIQSVKSVRHLIPSDLNNRSFMFKNCFGLGDQNSTNISKRSENFGDLFFEVADCRCCMPNAFYFQDIPEQSIDMASTCIGYHTKDRQKEDEKSPSWYSRIPIKFVGHLKDEQKNGERGSLLVDENPNIFLCRNRHNKLEIVELKFVGGGWQITSLPWREDYVLEGPSRFFMACRD